MRGSLIFYLLLISLISQAQQVTVDFTVKDIPDSTVYIGYYFGNQKYVQDTLAVESDAFSMTLEGSEVKTGLYFIYAPDYFLEFVMERQSFSLSTTYKGGYRELRVSGSPENELFRSFQLELGALQREQRRLNETIQDGPSEDSAKAVHRISEVTREMDTFREKVADEYPDSFTVSFLKLMEDVKVPEMDTIIDASKRQKVQYQYYKDHYFDQVDLADNSLLRTPLLHPKVMKYFDQVLMQHPDTLTQELDWFFAQVQSDPELFRYWLVTLFKHYAEAKLMGMDAVMVHLIEAYYLTDWADWVTEEYEKKLREEVAYVKPNLIGRGAPPLNVVDTLMQPFSLAAIDAPYTLLFIYDPDCGHCKKSMKELEKQDQALEALNVQVVAVCTVTDVDRWKEFVANSNPLWIHTIDPTGKSYFRVTYNVRSTPKLYLLDAQKRIVAKQLDVEQLVGFVKRDSHSQP